MRASEPVAMMMFFASSVCTPASRLHFDLAAALERGVALDPLHLVLLHQELDALGSAWRRSRSCGR